MAIWFLKADDGSGSGVATYFTNLMVEVLQQMNTIQNGQAQFKSITSQSISGKDLNRYIFTVEWYSYIVNESW